VTIPEEFSHELVPHAGLLADQEQLV